MVKKKVAILLGMASMMVLSSCGGSSGGGQPAQSSEQSTQSSSATSEGTSATSEATSEARTSESVPAVSESEEEESSSEHEDISDYLADGIYDYTTASNEERIKILAALESYAMKHHLAGIPLYDDASYQQFSDRITLPTTTYITNYGFGVGEATLDPSGIMYDGTIDEADTRFASYFHDYTTTDSGSFNFWDNVGSDVSGRNGMITSGYFEVEMTSDKKDYQWVAGLSKTDAPICLDAEGNEVPYEQGTASKYWRVYLKTGADGLKYSVPEISKWSTKYDGVDVDIKDYLTPFRALLDNRLARWSELGTDSSGFEGVTSYVYQGSTSDEAWSKVGIQVNEELGAMDFTFITPKTRSYAMVNLSSGLYSPVPAEFISDIGGAKKFGVIGTGEYNLDNFISVGAYVPEYWQQGKRLAYKANERYWDKENIHFAGVTEDVYEGTDGDKRAYNDFLLNKLDEVTIPASFLKEHKNDPNVYRTLGSSILKMNINSCTEEQWEYYFGENGTMTAYRHSKNDYWDVKPIMSNSDFLDGVFYAVDRKTLADDAGRNPAIGYLGNAYMMDPDGKQAYRDTEEGKAVVGRYATIAGNDECYNVSVAQTYFNRAVEALYRNDDLEDGQEIALQCWYRYQDTIDNVGKDFKQCVEYAFNNASFAKSHNITLNLILSVAGTQYTDCYTKMDGGDYDFAEGSIVGNSLNPLEFMNTVCTNDKSQGFCLNWGEITAKVNYDDPLEYDDAYWSYDALWSAANSMSIVEAGELRDIADNLRYEVRGKNVVLVGDYADVTDDYGESIFEFKCVTSGDNRPAYLFGETASLTSGYYMDSKDYEFIAENGEIVFSTNYESMKKNLLGSNYFCFMFTLQYSYTIKGNTTTAYKDIYLIAQVDDVFSE